MSLVAFGFAVSGGAASALSGETFSFTGSSQPYHVPLDVCSVTIDAFGAASGFPYTASSAHAVGQPAIGPPPALGGHATATVAVTPGETLLVYVGGRGADGTSGGSGAGGFNGGANGQSASTSAGTDSPSTSVSAATGGGGGASDVRQGGNALSDRVVVAGGAGSEGATVFASASTTLGTFQDTEAQAGGDGGGASGDPGETGAFAGGGGTQSSGGSAGTSTSASGTAGQLGVGGAGASFDGSSSGPNNTQSMAALGGAGGGGYYGGGGGAGVNDAEYANHDLAGGGGGGSGFGPAGTAYESGVQDGDGVVTITPEDDTSCLPGGGGPPGTPNTIPRPQVFPTTPTTAAPAARPVAPAAAAVAMSPRFTG